MNKREGSFEDLLPVDNEAYKNLERFDTISELTDLVFFDINLVLKDVFVSKNFFGWTGSKDSSRDIIKNLLNTKSIHADDVTKFRGFLRANKVGQVPDTVIFRRRSKNNKYCLLISKRKNFYDKYGNLIRILGTIQDITSEMQESSIKEASIIDKLTGISNYTTFITKSDIFISKGINHKYAILVFDIDKFAVINDIHGVHEGDKLLKYVGQTLNAHAEKFKQYCRLYSDNYAVLIEYKTNLEINTITELLSEELKKYPLKHDIKLSFGICMVGSKRDTAASYCERANIAKKSIKGNALKFIAYYDDTLRKQGIIDKDIESEMHPALEYGEFQIYLQPKVLIGTTEVVGAEALARWVHPKKGFIPTDTFIPIFERNGFIIKLDYYIWERTFQTVRKWLDKKCPVVPVSINVSRIHLNNYDFANFLIGLSKKYNVLPKYIELELTETIVFENIGEINRMLHVLKKEGFILALDDFGSGYSSLNMLKDMPIDIIKIDRGFLNETFTTSKGRTVIKYVIAMANELKMKIVAEGVKDFAQAEFLYHAGCDTAQGHFYSKPLSIKEFEQYAYHSF
jgi:diguanylate cyclase (GGDEF)-like protein